MRIWINYVPPPSNSKAIRDDKFTGKVVEVVSGDCIVVADDSAPYGSPLAERRVNLSSIRDKWLSEQKNLSYIAKDRENLWKFLEEKESELQNLLASARRGTLTSDTKQKSMPQKHERSLQVKNLEAQADMLRKELRLKSDELALTEENYKEVAIEKQLLEQKVILLEKNKNDETRSLYTMFEQERETLRNHAADLENKLTEQTQYCQTMRI